MRASESKRRALARLEAAARGHIEAARRASDAAANAQADAAWSAFRVAAVDAFPELPVSFVGPAPFVTQDVPSAVELGGFVAFAAWAHRLADGAETPEDAATLDAMPAAVVDGLFRHCGLTAHQAACVMSEVLRAF